MTHDVGGDVGRGEGGAVADAVRCVRVAKSYGAIRALRDVTMHLARGEVLGLIGDNGAGKSTLIKILTGYLRPDAGELWVHGEKVVFHSVGDARSHGIETVYQDLALIPELPVYHNLFLKRELLLPRLPFLHNRRMRREATQLLESMGVSIPDIDAPVAQLSGGQRQAIAIARAVHSDPRVLLLDEPLAAMGAKEGALILDLIRRLKQRGDVSIIVIAHNYAHVFEIGDRVNVLQHGEITFDRRTAHTSLDELTELMVQEYRRTLTG